MWHRHPSHNPIPSTLQPPAFLRQQGSAANKRRACVTKCVTKTLFNLFAGKLASCNLTQVQGNWSLEGGDGRSQQ